MKYLKHLLVKFSFGKWQVLDLFVDDQAKAKGDHKEASKEAVLSSLKGLDGKEARNLSSI